MIAKGLLLLTAVFSAWASVIAPEVVQEITRRNGGKKPNIVLIMPDDLDSKLNSLEYMPLTRKHIFDEGTTYPQHYCTVSLCCPSRTTILTGKHAHNHNVTDVSYPAGGYKKFIEQGLNDAYLPVWLQEAGYKTYYTGKIMNELHFLNYFAPYLKGWDGSDILLDPWSYDYWHPAFVRNKGIIRNYPGHYLGDLLADKALGFLDDALKENEPFFYAVGPVAPHGDIVVPNIVNPASADAGPPIPAPRHEGLINDVKVPRGENFNPEKPSGGSWVRQLPRLNETQIAANDEWYRNRLRTLQGVDELVDEIVKRLEAAGELDNTYIMFTSDNGYHISQHRLTPGKTCGYEEDVLVPMAIRGPGIPKGKVSDVVSAHVDLVPTFFAMAGIDQHDDFDGVPMPIGKCDKKRPKVETVNIEMWKASYAVQKRSLDFDFSKRDPTERPAPNTYKSIRVMGKGYSLYYSVWCNNERELYDMTVDPYQMHNLLPDGFDSAPKYLNKKVPSLGVTVGKLAKRLDGLLFLTKTCKGSSCRAPWEALMPGEGVRNLEDALEEEHDAFFEELPEVGFTSCEDGYFPWAEGPMFEDWEGRETRIRGESSDPKWALFT